MRSISTDEDLQRGHYLLNNLMWILESMSVIEVTWLKTFKLSDLEDYLLKVS